MSELLQMWIVIAVVVSIIALFLRFTDKRKND